MAPVQAAPLVRYGRAAPQRRQQRRQKLHEPGSPACRTLLTGRSTGSKCKCQAERMEELHINWHTLGRSYEIAAASAAAVALRRKEHGWLANAL